MILDTITPVIPCQRRVAIDEAQLRQVCAHVVPDTLCLSTWDDVFIPQSPEDHAAQILLFNAVNFSQWVVQGMKEGPSSSKHLNRRLCTTPPSTRFAQPAALWYDLDHGSWSRLEGTSYGLARAASRSSATLHRRKPASARTLVALAPA